uniref:serine C-palmitoyltransferase n=1 Tax=Wollemia nobilis TaxID=56998 RepID=A0A0C9S9D0_9CONI
MGSGFQIDIMDLKDRLIGAFDAPFAGAVLFGVHVDWHIVVEVLLVAVIGFLLFQKSYQPEKRPLTPKEIDQLCEEWVPEPLHPTITKEMEFEPPVLESAAGPRTIVSGREVINLASANYLGLIGDRRIIEKCDAALKKYGVGSCGPRGFYGTIDVHLDCEARISKFLGTPDSILYSYGLATPASAIPAFCKRGDLIIVDEGVDWGIQNGLFLSRSTVKLFKHNDMGALEKILQEVMLEDKRVKKVLSRRFIVVEAIYQNSGQMAPLDKIIRLKEKYKFRVLVDESNSFGVLGKSGRGLTEHYGIPVEKVDIITAGMGYALATTGGFCTGNAKVVDHQRLSGAGYCFSASLPPYLACAAIAAVDVLEASPELLVRLRENMRLLREGLSHIPGLKVLSDLSSPLVFLQLERSSGSFKTDLLVLQEIVDRMLEDESVLLAVSRRSLLDNCKLPAGIRLTVSAAHTESDLLHVIQSMKNVTASVLTQ